MERIILPAAIIYDVEEQIKVNATEINPKLVPPKSRFLVKTFIKKGSKKSEAVTLKKAKQSLVMLNLNESILNRRFTSLSLSEQTLVLLVITLINNDKVIKLKHVISLFDDNKRHGLVQLLRVLSKKYNKTFLLVDYDLNYCYEISDLIYLNNNLYPKQLLISEIDELALHQLPEPILFARYANDKYGKQIKPYLEIKELIKGIYRNE